MTLGLQRADRFYSSFKAQGTSLTSIVHLRENQTYCCFTLESWPSTKSLDYRNPTTNTPLHVHWRTTTNRTRHTTAGELSESQITRCTHENQSHVTTNHLQYIHAHVDNMSSARGRGGKFNKIKRGGGKKFSRDLQPLNADGEVVGMWGVCTSGAYFRRAATYNHAGTAKQGR